MYCRKCGKPIFDGDSFCTFCGERVSEAPKKVLTIPAAPKKVSTASTASVNAKPKHKSPVISILAGVLVFAVGGAIGYFIVTSPKSYEKPIETMVEGLEKRDVDMIASTLLPEVASERVSGSSDMREDLVEELTEGLYMMTGKTSGFDLGYRITSVEDLDQSEIENFEEQYESTYNTDLDITDAKRVELDLTVDGSAISTGRADVIKTGGDWFIYMF